MGGQEPQLATSFSAHSLGDLGSHPSGAPVALRASVPVTLDSICEAAAVKVMFGSYQHSCRDTTETTPRAEGAGQGSKGRSRSEERMGVGKFSTYQPDSVPLQTVQGLCQSQ